MSINNSVINDILYSIMKQKQILYDLGKTPKYLFVSSLAQKTIKSYLSLTNYNVLYDDKLKKKHYSNIDDMFDCLFMGLIVKKILDMNNIFVIVGCEDSIIENNSDESINNMLSKEYTDELFSD